MIDFNKVTESSLHAFMDEIKGEAKNKLKEIDGQVKTLSVFSSFSLEDMKKKDKDIFSGSLRVKHLYETVKKVVTQIVETKRWKIAQTQKYISVLDMHSTALNNEIETFVSRGKHRKMPIGQDSSVRLHLRNKMYMDRVIGSLAEMNKLLIFHQIAAKEVKKKQKQ